ncbi:GCF1 [Candida oxycetoniae]|uniref:GCF1 n=1 Tax=Candida oxycetoniae TaxID=497107 RepID=A0AAI9T1R7_9ASCO|nr:GCF1 [Candida oxycetoniae]KAI3406794.2 GCF1 [Candida oxycetoniae]
MTRLLVLPFKQLRLANFVSRPLIARSSYFIQPSLFGVRSLVSEAAASKTKTKTNTQQKTKKSTSSSKKSSEKANLKKKLKAAKTKESKLAKQLKAKQAKVKAISAKREKALLEKALRNPPGCQPFSLFAKQTKMRVDKAYKEYTALPEDVKAKYVKAANDYNAKIASMLTPKPDLKPSAIYNNFVQQTIDKNQPANDRFKAVALKWKSLTDEEKEKYSIPQEQKDAIKESKKKWQEARIKDYLAIQEFKKNFKVNIN